METSLSSRPADRIRAITFDVGDTLIRATPSVGHVYSGVCARHGLALDVECCNRAFEQAWKARSLARAPGLDRFSQAERGEEGYWEDLVYEVMTACGVAPERIPGIAAFREAFASADSWAVFDEVDASLTGLSRQGYELGIVSNWDSHLPKLLGRLDLIRHFRGVFVSAIEGVEKPHGRLFALACEGMGAAPGEILHVGDRIREDYDGAREAGMAALWLDRFGHGAEAASRVEPSHVIRSLSEVSAWLGNGGAPTPFSQARA